MLSYLRIKSKSIVVKGILGIMAVGLIFFFGSSAMRKAGQNGRENQTVATVNGEPVSSIRYEKAVEDQMERYKKAYGEELPKFIEEKVRTDVLDQLIERELIKEWAAKTEPPVSPREIAESILTNPQFLDETTKKFKEDFYKERFRPWFKENYGLDYEAALKEDLAIGKFFDDTLSRISHEGETASPLELTTIHLKRVEIDPKIIAKASEAPKDESEAKAKETAQKLASDVLASLAADKSGAGAEKLLKPFNLSMKDLEDKKLSEWRSIAPRGDGQLSAMKAILSLSADNPLLKEPIESGGKFYVYQWVPTSKKDTAEENPTPPRTNFTLLLRSAFLDSLHSKATIEIESSR